MVFLHETGLPGLMTGRVSPTLPMATEKTYFPWVWDPLRTVGQGYYRNYGEEAEFDRLACAMKSRTHS